MNDQKPPGITDEDWAKTPPSIRTLLAQKIARSIQSEPQSNPPASELKGLETLPVDVDPTGGTAFPDNGLTTPMPPTPPVEKNDGATRKMPPADDATTQFMVTADDDGRTTPMRAPASPAEEGATRSMPADDSLRPENSGLSGGTNISEMAAEPQQKPRRVSRPTVIYTEDDLWGRKIILQDRYRLRRILGKGGFGAAYLAQDLKLKRGCVVKQMLSPQGITHKELEINQVNFEREAALLVQLNHPGHPNIPEIFDYFSDDSGSYLVMKYIEGRSLKDLMKDNQTRIPWQEAVRHTIDICSALNYMHTLGEEPVLHRDIKPANVLLGDDGRIWLVDFGLAQEKPVESGGELSGDQAAGSIGYTPFEQWLGESTPASDVYATGVTLHHLITGSNPLEPYRDENGQLKVTIETLRDIHGQLEPIRKIDRKLPRELETIIQQATASKPEQRSTALQLKEQLTILVSGTKDAPLFTFKNGQAAHTIPQLVDLCEQNRVESQGYLYRGDFERWFILINRNDLAEAASKAIKRGEKGKDGLEKFLKLIMPNLFLRRLWKAGLHISRVGIQLLLIIILAALIVIVIGTFSTRWLLQRTIANYPWDYYALELDTPNVFTQTYLTEYAERATQLYLEDIEVIPRADDRIDINASLGNLGTLKVPVAINLTGNNTPKIIISEVNGVPLYWVADNLTDGINQGISEALRKAPVVVNEMVVNDGEIIVTVDKSGQIAYAPPTPPAGVQPTATARPSPTLPPPGNALLAVFNELERPILIEIEGETWLVPALDTKVIEQTPGTYSYAVKYAENGQLAAQGIKTWDFRAYKWRINSTGTTFE
jgi:serine/threonine protein kinase